MQICNQFDKYRDGELKAAERSVFESHLSVCEDCRMKRALLDHVVSLVRNEEVQPLDIADRIAHRAFQRGNSWASDVISWLHPLPAMAALMLVLVLFSSLLILSGNGKVAAYSEYEQLIEEANVENLGARLSQSGADTTIVDWLEQEGNSQ